MASFFVEQPNGLFARFSTIVDNFTHYDCTEAEVEKLIIDSAIEQAKRVAKEEISFARVNKGRFEKTINTIKHVHGEVDAERTKMLLTGEKRKDEEKESHIS